MSIAIPQPDFEDAPSLQFRALDARIEDDPATPASPVDEDEDDDPVGEDCGRASRSSLTRQLLVVKDDRR